MSRIIFVGAFLILLVSCSTVSVDELIREMEGFEYGRAELGAPYPAYDQCKSIIRQGKEIEEILTKALVKAEDEKVKGYAIYCMRMMSLYEHDELVSRVFDANIECSVKNPSFDMNFMMNQALLYIDECKGVPGAKQPEPDLIP